MLIKVKCHPSSKKEVLIKKDENAFDISVKEKPERGQANKRVVEILAGSFNVSVKKVRIIKGAKSPSKIFEIHD